MMFDMLDNNCMIKRYRKEYTNFTDSFIIVKARNVPILVSVRIIAS